ncbi:hypothetical protein BUALT_Bualt04G0163600 [Buddleja alternifolia]|uniref:U-box domain-containing protein n=1 Tax=Buddleja alternifolia TaxID=168488 RepID=A0AAV6XQX3_9LAMI|nr:hypothetical protein BUALT_Bualt04G0163600 [Buddleja alternifolia]
MPESLLFGEREAQILGAKEIGKLNSKQKQRLAEKGVISRLIFMLHSQDYESIEAALFALLNLAFGSERNKLRIAKSGAIPALVQILQWQYESLIELALAALLILSSCSANKPEIASSGAIQLLFALLDSQFPISQSISNQAKLDIISTLHNLSTSPQNIPSIVLSGGLISLIQLIYESEKSSEMAEKALSLLKSIVSSSEGALDQVSETGGVIHMLVAAVEEGSAECKEHAVEILLMICKRCRERYRVMILREGAMPGLLQLSVDGTRRAREMAKALLLLLRDCSNGGSSSSSSSARVQHSKSVMLEEVMRQIDGGERSETSIQLVEEMIAKLRT